MPFLCSDDRKNEYIYIYIICEIDAYEEKITSIACRVLGEEKG